LDSNVSWEVNFVSKLSRVDWWAIWGADQSPDSTNNNLSPPWEVKGRVLEERKVWKRREKIWSEGRGEEFIFGKDIRIDLEIQLRTDMETKPKKYHMTTKSKDETERKEARKIK
jgi:hypothetical protein